jgi:hypothetical protein
MSELTVEPTTPLAGYRKPALIVQGLQDLQVGPGDAQLLKHADPQAELELAASANHVLKAVRALDWTDNVAAYSDPNRPLADHVVEVISALVENSAAAHR